MMHLDLYFERGIFSKRTIWNFLGFSIPTLLLSIFLEIMTLKFLFFVVMITVCSPLMGMLFQIIAIVLELCIKQEWDYLLGFIRDLYK